MVFLPSRLRICVLRRPVGFFRFVPVVLHGYLLWPRGGGVLVAKVSGSRVRLRTMKEYHAKSDPVSARHRRI